MAAERIYLDHAATTPTDEAVVREMLPYFSTCFGNASSTHKRGRDAVAAVDRARERIARALGAIPSEIYFTSGGTESNNWAIRALAEANSSKGKHIISSAIEHPSLLGALAKLEESGYEVTYLPVNEKGVVSPSDVAAVIREDTTLVSVMTVNNEVGSLQPIREIAAIAHEAGALFHTDAVQAVGVIPIDVVELGIDALSISAHKFYGPKGIGALYLKKGTKIKPFLIGGEQEHSLRGGTYNTPGIVGMGVALERAVSSLPETAAHLALLKSRFLGICDPLIRLNGDTSGHPGIVNLTFFGIRNTEFLSALDREGIDASVGSACSSGSVEPSHVLAAVGLPEGEISSSIRFSFGKENTLAEVNRSVDVIRSLLTRLRREVDLFRVNPSEKIEG